MITTIWSKVSGPGAVTFGNIHAIYTTARLSYAGKYVLRLSASEGALSISGEVTITVKGDKTSQASTLLMRVRPDSPAAANRDFKRASHSLLRLSANDHNSISLAQLPDGSTDPNLDFESVSVRQRDISPIHTLPAR